MKRLGILGGTFDPVHLGHLDAARKATEALRLDRVLFIPAHDPPHRPRDPKGSAFHRFALISLAIQDQERYAVSDMELRRTGASYTALTLRDLHGSGWSASQIFFIIGSDAFAEIATWYDYPAILDACHFVVIAREGTTLDAAIQRNPALAGRVRPAGADAGVHTSTGVFPVLATTMPVSSTEVRARLAAGRSVEDLVPAAVARYIHRHGLYRTDDHLHGQD